MDKENITWAVRLYGASDIRLERFELPPIKDDEILAEVITDSLCMSSHKAVIQGKEHKRVPVNIEKEPVIIGHEFAGRILKVGKKYKDKIFPGDKFTIQPALNYPGRELDAPGYSFKYIGGNATRIIIPPEVMEMDCLLIYKGDTFFKASLAEPLSCVIGAFNTQYHYLPGKYEHINGIKDGGKMAILAGAGPMGLAAIDYALHGPKKPKLLVVTDIDQSRLNRACSIFPPEKIKQEGTELIFLNTSEIDAVKTLLSLTDEKGFDDVFVFAPVPELIQQASEIMGFNGCLNFFAGPTRKDFYASINFYSVHYLGHHVVGFSGGNTDDMRQALLLISEGKLNPAILVTHIGGLDCVPETTLNLPRIPGGKKLIYTHKSMPLIALDDLENLANRSQFYRELYEIVKKHNGLWSDEAEKFFLEKAVDIENLSGNK